MQPRRLRLLPAFAVAVALAACSQVGIADVPLRTQEPVDPAAPAPCMMALMTGMLARHPVTGLGVAAPDGTVSPVIWPNGYRAVVSADGLAALQDATGTVIATEGEQVSLGGGSIDDLGTFLACGGVTPG